MTEWNDFELTDAFAILSEKFAFLTEDKDWGFTQVEARQEAYGCYLGFQRDSMLLHLGFDYAENFYYFDVRVGETGSALFFLFEAFAAAEGEELDRYIFFPAEAGRMTALETYVTLLQRYRQQILDLAATNPV